jgi:putative abortive infection protein
LQELTSILGFLAILLPIHKDENYEKNYLIGKYGAIPTLKSIDIFKGEGG